MKSLKKTLSKRLIPIAMLTMIGLFSLSKESKGSSCENCIWSGTHITCDPTDVLQIYTFVNEDCGTATSTDCFDFVFGYCP